MIVRGRQDVVQAIGEGGIVAIVRLDDAALAADVARALAAGGVTALEITMTVPRAADVIAALRVALPADVLVGAGTVIDAVTASAVIDAGAAFVVSPVFKPAVVELCHREGVAAMPGCFTPTEILTAWEAGADVVKVFPAASLGPGFIKDVRAPLPQVRLMPTGGVTRENAGAWIRAGAIAIGVGTALVERTAVEQRRFDAIADRARQFVNEVRMAREGAVAGR